MCAFCVCCLRLEKDRLVRRQGGVLAFLFFFVLQACQLCTQTLPQLCVHLQVCIFCTLLHKFKTIWSKNRAECSYFCFWVESTCSMASMCHIKCSCFIILIWFSHFFFSFFSCSCFSHLRKAVHFSRAPPRPVCLKWLIFGHLHWHLLHVSGHDLGLLMNILMQLHRHLRGHLMGILVHLHGHLMGMLRHLHGHVMGIFGHLDGHLHGHR